MLRTRFPPWIYVPFRRCFLFTVQSCVTPRPCFRTFHKCASLEFPSPYHFSRPHSLHEITPTIPCHFYRSFELWIPFVIVAFSGTRVGAGFLSSEGEQASKESLALLTGHAVEGRRLPSPRSFPTLFWPRLQKANHQRAVQSFIHRTTAGSTPPIKLLPHTRRQTHLPPPPSYPSPSPSL